MSRGTLPIAIATSFAMAMVLSFHEPSLSADAVPPAVAERPVSADDSLNPLVDLVRAKRESETKLRETLKKPVTISFKNIPLKEAMQRLGQAADVNIWIDKSTLGSEGFEGNELVSCTAKAVTLHQALQQILSPLGLDYSIEKEVIQIATAINTAEKLQNRYYEVGDLLKWEEDHRYEPRALPKTLFEVHRLHAWLVDTLQHETSGPWIDIDGTGGYIEFQGSVMMVRQTEKVHGEIPPILRMFRLFIEDKFGKSKSVFLQSLSDLNSDLSVRRALARRVTLKFEVTPLKDVAEHLTKEMRIAVRLDRDALSEEGINGAEPITFQIKNVTLQSAVELMLDSYGLQAIVYDGALWITTLIAAEERRHTTAYDVRDLLRDGAVHSSFFPRQLWDEMSGPWQEVDGTGGTISEPLPGLLLISQYEKVHEEIVAFFEDLRERTKARKAKGLPPQATPDVPKPDDMVTAFYHLPRVKKPKELQQAIYDLVEPLTWELNGGEGSIHNINNLLVIKNRSTVHQKVHRFLVRVSQTLEKLAPENAPFGNTPNLYFGDPIEADFQKLRPEP